MMKNPAQMPLAAFAALREARRIKGKAELSERKGSESLTPCQEKRLVNVEFAGLFSFFYFFCFKS